MSLKELSVLTTSFRSTVGFVAVAITLFCSCKNENPAPANGNSGDRLTIAVIPKGTSHEFWKSVEAGAREAAEELDVDMKWDGPNTESEHDKQRSIIDSMVGLGVDGIALAPTDEKALARPVKSAVEQGVPVVIFDSDIEGDSHVSFVATDNEEGGRLGGEKLVELMGPGGGNVVLLKYAEGSGSTMRREKGFLEVVKKPGNIEVVAQQYTDGSAAGATTTSANMLNGLIENNKLTVDGIFASNESTTLGMLNALARLKKQGVEVHAKFVGFDASEKLMDGLRAGAIDALVVQNPRKMGRLAVETLVKHIKGKPVEKVVDTGVEVVSLDRLQEPEIRQLLGLSNEAN